MNLAVLPRNNLPRFGTAVATSKIRKDYMQEVYVLAHDNSDGTASIVYLRDKKLADKLIEDREGEHFSAFSMNSDGYDTLVFPEDVDLSLCGMTFSDRDYED